MTRSTRRYVILASAGFLIAGLSAAAVTAALRSERPSGAARSRAPSPVQLQFENEGGRALNLADFRGKALLVNLWATWCVPCREEMPTLDRLQAQLGGPEFGVLALSLDRGGAEVVRSFFDEIGVTNLSIHLIDIEEVQSEIGLIGLPTTLLLDREGREVSRLIGPAEWDSPERIASVRGELGLLAPSRTQINQEGDQE